VRPQIAKPAAAIALVAIMACVADGLWVDQSTKATVAVNGTDVRVTPDIADGAAWASATSWQGKDELRVDKLERVGPGHYRLARRPPADGSWKSMIRIQRDRAILSAPVFLPEDKAIPAKEVPLSSAPRQLVPDKEVLQREQKAGVAGSLKTIAPLIVLLIALSFAGALSWGVARIGRPEEDVNPPRASAPRIGATPLPH
jgi:hypothetical protein